MRIEWGCIVAIAILAAAPARGQEEGQENSKIEDLEKEIARIRDLYERRLGSLEAELERIKAEKKTSAIEELRRKAAERAARSEKDERIDDAAARLTGPGSIVSTNLNAFNPRITVFGDFLGRSDSSRVPAEDDPELNAGDRFAMRELELDLRADVDPYAKAVAILALEENFGEYEPDLEEAYIDLHTIPGFEDVRHGLRFEVGRFLGEFGVTNRLHRHDLMWFERPLPALEFLGDEGFFGQGVGFDWLVPNPWDEAFTFTFQLVNGESDALFAGGRSNDLAYLGRLEWHKQLTTENELVLGSSVLAGNAETDGPDDPFGHLDDETRPSTLVGFDAFWRWRPEEGRDQTSFLVQSEAYLRYREEPRERTFLAIPELELDGAGNPVDPQPEPEEIAIVSMDDRFRWGFFVAPQYQFMKNFTVGARFDYLSGDEGLRNHWGWKTGGYLSYYTTEFLRFRVGYEHEDDGMGFRNDSVMLQVTWVFGSHPVEPYWANR